MLEKLKFQQLVEETLTVKRETRAMPWYQFVLSMVLALYVEFSRLQHLRFLARDPMLVGILRVLELPPQCTFWRFLASLHLTVAQQLVEVQRQMRQRVWEAANVKLSSVTFDTDTTVHRYTGASPAKKSIARIKQKVGDHLVPSQVGTWPEVRDQLNQMLKGWAAYFSYGTRRSAYQAIDHHVHDCVRHFLRRRHKVPTRGNTQFSFAKVFGELGVFRLRKVQSAPRS